MTPMPIRDNIFPIEAVATFGLQLRTYDGFQYMQRCQELLDEYLFKYEKRATRYGGAIGLKGAHGSGKTHLLSWIAQKAGERKTNRPCVCYAKADTPNFFDLYVQIFAQLKREDILLTITEAVKNLAVDEVNKADVTRSVELRLRTSAQLQQLFSEGNLDREALFLKLRRLLLIGDAPEEITEALLLIESSVLGERAYNWLSGKRIESPDALGISYQLSDLPIESEGASIADVTAVNALETLSALFEIAGRPLIILIDQLEILMRADENRRQTVSSVIKKLIEQLGRQNALIFIAGTAEPWDRLPRDVAPRLRNREPLSVGTLSPTEANLLLLDFAGKGLKPDPLNSLMNVSGGSLREILRMSHYVFGL